jgi:hypothetical protein
MAPTVVRKMRCNKQKPAGKGNVVIGREEGVLNSSEPTLTRVDVHPISSYNSFLDGVLVVDGSCTHEPKDKDRNSWESMKPVPIHPTGQIVFVPGWLVFFILVFPMCSIWSAQPIPSRF